MRNARVSEGDVTLFQLTRESNPGMIFHLKSSVYQKSDRLIHINRKGAPRVFG